VQKDKAATQLKIAKTREELEEQQAKFIARRQALLEQGAAQKQKLARLETRERTWKRPCLRQHPPQRTRCMLSRLKSSRRRQQQAKPPFRPRKTEHWRSRLHWELPFQRWSSSIPSSSDSWKIANVALQGGRRCGD
jgi:hypothetical protein